MSLYHEAAELLTASSHEGGSLKSRVFGRKNIKSPPNQLYALVFESCKWSGVLKEVIEGSELLKHERKLTPNLSVLLVHDLLLAKKGIALPQSHGLRASIEKHKGRLTSELTRARLRRKAPSLEALRALVEKEAAGEDTNYPRWVRVNAIKSTLEEQLETTFRSYTRSRSIKDVVNADNRSLFIDLHVPNLLAITPGTDLSKTEAYTSGKIILQDKASCFPAYLLDPLAEDGDVVDACAAPGNKTTHLAGILHSHKPEFAAPGQTIFAFEKDARRAQTLDKMVKIAGSKATTRIAFGQDFLQTDPNAEQFKDVGGLLLDPSCSGSGIVGRDSMPDLHLPQTYGEQKKRKRKLDDSLPAMVDDDGNETVVESEKDLTQRLDALSVFQLTILLHAFKFPRARKVTYSTCSIHGQENEHVVMKALASTVARQRGWKILQRDAQVRGMQEWPVRGLVEACDGDEVVAEGCIRSYKGDGRGVMGFFVAAFVRDTSDEAVDEPYIRDENGRIVRDVTGMPVLKATGEAITLEPDEVEARNDTHVSEESEASDSESEWEGFGQ